MRLRVSDQAWNPNQHTKQQKHECHEAYRKPCLAINENGKRREFERDRCEYRPKHLVGRNPPRNKVSRETQIEYLSQRKGNRAHAQSKARPSTEGYRLCRIRLSRSIQCDCSAEQGKLFKEAPVFSIDGWCLDDARNAGQRKTPKDNAQYDRSQARSARVLHRDPT